MKPPPLPLRSVLARAMEGGGTGRNREEHEPHQMGGDESRDESRMNISTVHNREPGSERPEVA